MYSFEQMVDAVYCPPDCTVREHRLIVMRPH